MKYNLSHFKTHISYYRPSLDCRSEYLTLVKKQPKERTDDDKNTLREWRKEFKTWREFVEIKHKNSGATFGIDLTGQSYYGDLKKRLSLIKDNLPNVIAEIKTVRKKLRQIQPLNKEYFGAKYATVGGTFLTQKEIIKLGPKMTIHDPGAVKKPGSLKQNFIGVELEFNNDLDISTNELIRHFKLAKLGRFLQVSTDHCGFELRCLFPENNFEKPLIQILTLLKDLGFGAVKDCGTHVHLDMRNRNPNTVFHNLFYTQDFMRKFLTAHRKRNRRYCAKNELKTIQAHRDQSGSRYFGINPMSLEKHQTIEVRMHQGTLNAEMLIPWLKLLIRLANYSEKITERPVKTLKTAAQIYNFSNEFQDELKKRILLVRNKTA